MTHASIMYASWSWYDSCLDHVRVMVLVHDQGTAVADPHKASKRDLMAALRLLDPSMAWTKLLILRSFSRSAGKRILRGAVRQEVPCVEQLLCFLHIYLTLSVLIRVLACLVSNLNRTGRLCGRVAHGAVHACAGDQLPAERPACLLQVHPSTPVNCASFILISYDGTFVLFIYC
jgi:hypothetical protein